MDNRRYDISLYNHKKISDGTKPVISNAEFKELYERVVAGDISYYSDCCDRFFLEPKQDKIINDLIHKRIL